MITARAFAKINWTLDILGGREDGYHEMDMLMQSVSCFDTLCCEHCDDVLFSCDDASLVGPDNLVLRAATLLRERFGVKDGADMRLVKRIPVQAGLGGGSADAAAALVALNRLWGIGLGPGDLEELGAHLGSDVPFCVRGGIARARGRGERLARLRPSIDCGIVIVMPETGLSTRAVFKAFDARCGAPSEATPRAIAAMEHGELSAFAKSLGNSLAPVAQVMVPDIGRARETLTHLGALSAQISGSGPAVFGVFESFDAALCAAERAKETWTRVLCTRPVACGVDIAEEA